LAHAGGNVIRSFADRETERVFAGDRSRKLPGEIQQTAFRKLVLLSNARRLDDMKVLPGNHLEALTGNRAGQHSIRINDQWRICFRWAEGEAYDVAITDYH
jgi:proteic killer suppression protein